MQVLQKVSAIKGEIDENNLRNALQGMDQRCREGNCSSPGEKELDYVQGQK